jgi:CBS domain-containing protein
MKVKDIMDISPDVLKVKDIMDTSPDILRVSDTFENLVKVLDKVKYHTILVVDKENKLAGILTEGDIIKVLIPTYITFDESLITVMDASYFENKCKESKGLTLTEIMTKNIITVREDDTVIKVAALMFTHRIHILPVLRDNEVVGIVPRKTLIELVTRTLAENKTGGLK